MNEHVEETGTTWKAKLAAPFLGVLAIACCLGAPLIVGALGALSVGAVFGVGAGLLLLAVLCFLGFRKLAGERC